MKRLSLILLTIIALCSCQNEKKFTGYTVTGTLKNIADNSVVYITKNNKVIDSAIVLNNEFKLTGKLGNPVKVYLKVKNTRDYTSFWLENSNIKFDAEKGKFKEALISGSKIQQEQEILSAKIDKITNRMIKLGSSVHKKMTKVELDSIKREFDALGVLQTTINQKYIEEFPNSLVSAYILNMYATTWGKEKTKELFQQLSTENKDSEYGLEIRGYIKLNRNINIGEQFVDFELKDQYGNPKKLSELKGKTILLEFWASWCGPCRKENPNLVKTYNKFNPKGFEIFAVSLDNSKKRWLEAIEKDNLNWSHVSDLKGDKNEASLIYGVSEIPDNFLIADNGEIIGRNLRGDKLNDKLKEILE